MRTLPLPALLLLAAVALTRGAQAHAQTVPPAPDVRQEDALRIFVDCGDLACDPDYLRTEIRIVNYVRDRQDAQVYILVATQPTGAGGTEFTVDFIGQNEFQGANDRLRLVAAPAESRDRIRHGLTQLLKRGLVRYMNRTPLADRVQISYAVPGGPAATAVAPARDRWNQWTFSTTVTGFFNGEESSSGTSMSAALSANRTTEAWKISTSLQSRYNESRIDAGEAGTFTSIQRNHLVNGLVVRSLSGHWSAGARGTVTSSTFLNQSLTVRLAPAVEYNVFPYTEATRRQFTIQYSVGATSLDYMEETIFGKTSETLADQRILASLQIRQPWGSVSTAVEGSHFLHDFDRQRAVAVTNIDLHLFRGLSLVAFGGVELVRDQIFLPRRGASREEILLQQRQLATSFRHWSSLGLSYTFGSRFANIVNPRFAGSVGGTSITQ